MSGSGPVSEARQRLLQQYLQGRMGVRQTLQPIPRCPADQIIPLSFAQEQVWMHAQMAPNLPLYNEPVTIHYTGALDISALERAFNEILRRHEAWRTSFVTVDGMPIQKVHPPMHVPLPLSDLRAFPAEERDREAVRVATEDATQPLDLTRAPLFRARVIRVAKEEYRLYLALSHIIFDGVAIYRVFLPELAALYAAFEAGKPSPLPELPVQYGDFAVWQRQSMTPDVLAQHLEWWRQQHIPDLPVLELPTDRPRPPVQTFRGSMYPFVLGKELTNAVRALSQRAGVTLFQALLATFAVLLARYSGEETFAIGSVTSGRDCPETQSLLGYFLNTLVLRADLSGNPTFFELARRMREVTLSALEHDCVPFSRLIQELSPTRDLSRNPLFQVLFSLEPPMPAVDPRWRLTQMDVDTGATKYDLYLELDERQEGVLARFHYSTDLFDLSTIERMTCHWIKLIEEAARHPEMSVSDLPLLSESERQPILAWNNTDSDYPTDKCIHELIAEQGWRRPDATAASFAGDTLTYSDLNQKSNRLARYLRKRGAGPGALVGVHLERSLDMLVALVGVIKSGAAYVPLDPAYPRERLEFIIQDANIRVVVTQRALVRDLRQGLETICLDSDWPEIATEDAAQPDWPVSSNELAYVPYTSGSTGTPKGVAVEHRSVVNFLTSMLREPGFTERDVLLAVTTLSFDIAGLELYLPLVAGGRVVIASREQAADGAALQSIIRDSGINVLQATPATWRILLESGWTGNPELKILCGGEALSRELAEALLPRCGELWNMYGPTETTIWSSIYKVRTTNWATAPIGRPIANTQIYVLDEKQRLQPVGVAGEIFIGGDGLARGYWNKTDLTASRFVADPFGGAGARLYRTGDRGRYLPDGNIQYLGRTDTQVKVRGFRIELGEIEGVLSQYPGVQQAAVAIHEETADKRIVGYLVGEEKKLQDLDEIRSFVRQKLPDYMLPSRFVILQRMPLTPNGKLDRKSLPAPPREVTPSCRRAPQDNVETQLVAIFESVLGVRPVGVTDDFFRLGGHSLMAVQVIARIRKTFAVELPVRIMFEKPTVVGIADQVRKSLVSGEKMRTPSLQVRSRSAAAASTDDFLGELERLPNSDAQSLLRRILQGKQSA